MNRLLATLVCLALGACQPPPQQPVNQNLSLDDWNEKNRQLEAQLDPVKDAALIQAIEDSKKPRTYPRDPLYQSPIKDYAGESLHNAEQIRLYKRAVRQMR